MKSIMFAMFTIITTWACVGQTAWTKHGNNPVLGPGSAGTWDDEDVLVDRVIFDGSVYKMWYSGYDGTYWRIGYATSPDGFAWTKHSSNPVLDVGPETWNSQVVYRGKVINAASGYKMWYTGTYSNGTNERVGYASSVDGVTWTKSSGPVVNTGPSSWDGGQVGRVSVMDTAGGYKMWYSGFPSDYSSTQIGYATAPDETTWTKFGGNPVLTPGAPGGWDDQRVLGPTVIHTDGEYRMWYVGSKSGVQSAQIGYATSPDGIAWTKYDGNPVLPRGTGWDSTAVSAHDVLFDGTKYRMWYSGFDGTTWRIGYAEEAVTAASSEWTQYAGNPVMNLGAAGSWDRGSTFLPCVLKSGDTLKMWYGGTDTTVNLRSPQIGYAWSLDGISWTRSDSNPVLPKRPGEWDDGGTAPGGVVQDGDTLRMWYSGNSAGGSIGPGRNPIGYATSVDGITWNRLPAAVLFPGVSGEWDADIFYPGNVIKEDTLYRMWYSGGTGSFVSSSHVISIGYATSPDGINWTKHNDPATTGPPFQYSDPVLLHGASGDFDSRRAWNAWINKTVGGYEMWYTGGTTSTQVIMYATSADGITWNKHAAPVLQVTGWAVAAISPSVIRDNGQYQMWFSGFLSGGITARIGYATALIVSVREQPSVLPVAFQLEQNYPNPFNPSTTIEFQIPEVRSQTSEVRIVTLKVYSLLGQEVATLVNEDLRPGSYQVMWNASGVPSGVYFYRLTAGSFTEMKKLVLVR